MRTVAMMAGSQSGKDLALPTQIPTPDGFVSMGSINIGDTVYDSGGRECRVTYVSPIYTNNRCFEITFDDGSIVIAGEGHQWEVRDSKRRKNDARAVRNPTRQGRPQCVPSVRGIFVTNTLKMYYNQKDNRGSSNYSVDVSAPIQGNDVELEIPPYVLGAWLGDGTSSSPDIANHESDYAIIEKIISLGVKAKKAKTKDGKCPRYIIGEKINGRRVFSTSLSSMKLKNNKHIPMAYKKASFEQRLELLRGLLDTDGGVTRNGIVELYTTKKQLANDYCELVSSLGIKSRMWTKDAKLYGRKISDCYTIRFQTKLKVFYLKRKQDRIKKPTKKNHSRLYITNIKEVEKQQTKCIAVDSPNHLYLITNKFIPTHNTSFAPWWLKREIKKRGKGDYIAVTSSYDLFKLKLLPAMLDVFVGILGIGRYWAGDRIIELCNPDGVFLAKKTTDRMYSRIILRSADALGGLESATAKAAILDECGQDRFTFEAYKAIRRRLTLYRGRILISTTLYNLGWTSTIVIEPALNNGETHYYPIGNGVLDHTVAESKGIDLIQFDSIINPMFPEEEFEEAREMLSIEDFNMFFRGRRASMRLMIYNSFDRNRHICEKFDIDPSWKTHIGLDFGGANMVCVYYAEDPKTSVLYAYAEYHGSNKPIKDHASDILAKSLSRLPPRVVGGGPSEEQWRMEFRQYQLNVEVPATPEVEIGISRVYAQHKKDGIIYFRNLHGTLDEKGRYRRKRDRSGNILDEIQDKRLFHYMDAERYIIGKIRPGVPLRVKILRLGEAIR